MLRKIYLKEMKDAFRDRRTLLLTVFLPILMMSALTFFYESLISDGEEKSYTLAVQEDIGHEENIFADYENIELVKYENPEEAVKNGEVHAAILFSEGFIDQVNSAEKAKVTIIGDSFSQNSSNLMNLLENILSNYEKAVISNRVMEAGMDLALIQPFAIEYSEISGEDPNINILAILIPLILSIAIGVGASPSSAEIFAGEKEKKTMEALLMTPVSRSTLVWAKWLTISSIGTIIGIVTLIVVAIEIFFFTEHLKAAVNFNGNAIAVIGLAIVISIIYAMVCASILMITSIVAKTVKEAGSYSAPVMMIAIFPMMIIMGVGVSELSFVHFAIPIMNLFSVMKELVFGVIDVQHIGIAIVSNLVVTFVLFMVGRIMFMKDKWVMN
ncbi:ABC transporter permease protein NatB [Compostibacillus humi]|uniref:ABC transporter permease protein NatB n=1 Tax=Compostibacillus humi TaxID=1245525 RepID=A0A8J2X9X0_9BACI|nr:ABC transporter permease subunit [Compostibacillus humi]GFZ85133.1 ABC transporter permease protein NatB [Compostibacillus humi]